MQEQGVVGLGALDEPLHGADDVGLGGLHDGVLRVVGQDDHVLALVVVVFAEEVGHVVDVVDAAAQLALLAKVVDADEQRLALTRAVGVLERVALGRTVAELLRRRRGRRAGLGVVAVLAALHRVAVGVQTGRRRLRRRRVLVIRARTATGPPVGTRSGGRRTVIAILRRRATLGRTVLALRRTIVALRRTVVVLRRAVVVVAGAAVLRRRRARRTVGTGAVVAVTVAEAGAAVGEAAAAGPVVGSAVVALAGVSRHAVLCVRSKVDEEEMDSAAWSWAVDADAARRSRGKSAVEEWSREVGGGKAERAPQLKELGRGRSSAGVGGARGESQNALG